MNKYITQLLNNIYLAKSEAEIDNLINEIIPLIKLSGINISEIENYLNNNYIDFITESQDHTETNSNAEKTRIILEKLKAKLKK